MRDVTVRSILERINVLGEREVLEKLKAMKVDENGDRLRIIFEFEFGRKPIDVTRTQETVSIIKDAVEIRHRRPWE